VAHLEVQRLRALVSDPRTRRLLSAKGRS
jgi:hypothetical protein